MKTHCRKFLLLWFVGCALIFGAQIHAKTSASSTRTTTQISRVTYQKRAAFRLSDGKTEAVVVPSLGRVMRFGRIDGVNFLWNNAQQSFKKGDWANWGGDKSWPAPQSAWPLSVGSTWPPHVSWDGDEQTARVLPSGHLQMTSGVWPVFGCRLTREFWFDGDGEFVIEQTAEKVGGAPVQMSIWSIAQTTPDAVFLPTNPNSIYKNNFQWLVAPKTEAAVSAVNFGLLQIDATSADYYKIGVDAPVSAIAAIKNNVIFRLSSAKPAGDYPDGNCPIEIFGSGLDKTQPQNHYIELEILGPMRVYRKGTKWTHTLRWSLHDLPAGADATTVQEVVNTLLNK